MLIKAASDAGVDPPASAVPPELPVHLESYISEFWTLSSCRVSSQAGPGPIPWTAMDQYAERCGYTDNVLLYEDFLAYMTALDFEYLAVMHEEISKKTKAAESKSNRAPATQPKRSKW